MLSYPKKGKKKTATKRRIPLNHYRSSTYFLLLICCTMIANIESILELSNHSHMRHLQISLGCPSTWSCFRSISECLVSLKSPQKSFPPKAKNNDIRCIHCLWWYFLVNLLWRLSNGKSLDKLLDSYLPLFLSDSNSTVNINCILQTYL